MEIMKALRSDTVVPDVSKGIRNNNNFIYLLFFAGFVSSVFSQCSAQSSKHAPYEVLLKVISPYHCVYSFHVADSIMYIQSSTIEYGGYNQNREEKILGKKYTVIDQITANILSHFCDSVHISRDTLPKLFQFDGYLYELYINQKLFSRNTCCDDRVYFLTRVLKKYIDKNQMVICSDFFERIRNIPNSGW